MSTDDKDLVWKRLKYVDPGYLYANTDRPIPPKELERLAELARKYM